MKNAGGPRSLKRFVKLLKLYAKCCIYIFFWGKGSEAFNRVLKRSMNPSPKRLRSTDQQRNLLGFLMLSEKENIYVKFSFIYKEIHFICNRRTVIYSINNVTT